MLLLLQTSSYFCNQFLYLFETTRFYLPYFSRNYELFKLLVMKTYSKLQGSQTECYDGVAWTEFYTYSKLQGSQTGGAYLINKFKFRILTILWCSISIYSFKLPPLLSSKFAFKKCPLCLNILRIAR